jgi:hypothetical protein
LLEVQGGRKHMAYSSNRHAAAQQQNIQKNIFTTSRRKNDQLMRYIESESLEGVKQKKVAWAERKKFAFCPVPPQLQQQ